MKPEKIQERLAELLSNDRKKPHSLAGDSEELSRLARDLGHELPKKRPEILAEFRAILARAIPTDRYVRNYLPEDGYIRGYLAALCEVAAAYSAAIQPEMEKEVSED